MSGELDGVSNELDNCVCRLSLERWGERLDGVSNELDNCVQAFAGEVG